MRLQTIVRLRWLAVLGQTITVIGAYWVLGIDLPVAACLVVISLSAWLNVALRIRYPASQRLKSVYAFLMLAYDILQLGALLYLTGGMENPFAFLLDRASDRVRFDLAAPYHGGARAADHRQSRASSPAYHLSAALVPHTSF